MTNRRKFIKDSALGAGALTLGLGGASSKLFANESESKSNITKKITTVRGDILPEKLGFTTIHEHTIFDLAFMRDHVGFVPQIPKDMLTLKPENYASLRGGLGIFSEECSTLGDVDYMVKELQAFKHIGGNAVCDATPIGARGNPNDLKAASERADVHIVCATGLYHAKGQPKEYMSKSEKELIAIFEKEIREGIDGTGIKPGFLKCAFQNLNADNTIHEIELKTFKACAKVAATTGLSLHVHTNRPITCDHILHAIDIAFNECGMKPDRLHIMHLDSFLRTPSNIADYYSNIESVRGVNTDFQTRILDKGVSIGFDSWGMLTAYVPDDFDRMKGLVNLLRKGYASQIALGHDIYDKSRSVSYGYTGFTHFATFALPILKQLGFGNDVIAKLTVENPARILAY
jgi:phosphotriesterase-related protein